MLRRAKAWPWTRSSLRWNKCTSLTIRLRRLPSQPIVAAGYDEALVTRILRLVDTAEYKRRQYPPGTKITSKGFGKDRRLPITNRWRERA